MIPADLIGGGPCKQSPKCTPGWAALPLPPQGQWTVVGHGRTQDGDTGGPWEDPEEGDTGRLWEDPGRGHWRAVGGPGKGDTGRPREDPGTVPCRPWCRCGPGWMGAIPRPQVRVRPEPLRLKRPGVGGGPGP